jgi:predicted RNA binding protein YcfA (HicA-like mRNA interferase family)
MPKTASKQEVINACEKLGFENKTSKRAGHLKYVYFAEGKQRARVTVPRGRGELPSGTLESIRTQMHLDKVDFGMAIQCPFGPEDYGNLVASLIEAQKM